MCQKQNKLIELDYQKEEYENRKEIFLPRMIFTDGWESLGNGNYKRRSLTELSDVM